MPSITPTYGAIETGRNVRAFIKGNMDTFQRVMKPLMPILVVLAVLMALPTDGSIIDATLAQILVGLATLAQVYVYAFLAISWHRATIEGPEKLVLADPAAPQRNDWAFIGYMILNGVLVIGIISVLGILSVMMTGAIGITSVYSAGAGMGPVFILIAIAVLVAIFLAVYLAFRFSFVLPARAVGDNIGLGKAFGLSRGLFWKATNSYVVAAWRFFLLTILYSFVMGFGIGFMQAMSGEGEKAAPLVTSAVTFAFSLPMDLYFSPVLTIFGVSMLSNYYMHASLRKAGDKPAA